MEFFRYGYGWGKKVSNSIPSSVLIGQFFGEHMANGQKVGASWTKGCAWN